jgi:class 3 adenylate cyclase/pimeloyl-ACP methyl ester carboxylesterase
MSEIPEVRYARSGDIDIAYTIVGEGPVDVVFVPGFISHQEIAYEMPYSRRFRDNPGPFRWISFDKRGTGLSDRTLGFGSVAERMDDIRAVMDDAGVEKAALYGVSEGGPMAILFAATYPERTAKLVLYGTFARMLWAPDFDIGIRAATLEEPFRFMREQWGSGHVLRMFVQNAPDEALPMLARYERNSCTPHMVEEIMRRNVEMDVTTALSAITSPTLVVHSRKDPIVPARLGRYMAERIPGAQYVERQMAVHGDWNQQDLLPEIREFLAGEQQPLEPDVDRLLSTVLFTDIVSSTERTMSLGDKVWRDLLDDHDRVCATEVARFSGRVVKTTGDGFLATFDGPARAIGCAQAIKRQARTINLDIRAGLHTGEIERRGDDITGIGVVIARRVCDAATNGEVLTSRTVKDLVTGSGIAFADRGAHTLKGVPDEWQLYAVGA